MGFLKPKVVMPPPMPDPAPMPTPPDPEGVEETEALEEEQKRLRNKKGRKSTILTSVLGDTSAPELKSPSLLGG